MAIILQHTAHGRGGYASVAIRTPARAPSDADRLPPLPVALCVHPDVPEAERALCGVGATAARPHPPHRDGHVPVDLNLLRIDLATAVAAGQGCQPLRSPVDAAHGAAGGSTRRHACR